MESPAIRQTAPVTYKTSAVPVRGGYLAVGTWGTAGPLVVAVHGITASHMAWVAVGPRLADDHLVVAPDLRGRGASRDVSGPCGIASHAEDVARVIRTFGGGPAILVGHSMGGFVAVETARRFTDLVQRLVLVDGGAPFPPPPGVDPGVGEERLSAAIAEALGPAFARLSMTFATKEAYRDLWRQHPALPAEWTEEITAYVDYDLVGEAPFLHPACRVETALRDARDLYAYDGMSPQKLPVPGVFLRAERGMLDEPDKPFYPPGYPSRWLLGVEESTVEGVNHYTATLGPAGIDSVVSAVRC